MTGKKFCDDKVLVVFLYIDLVASLLTAHEYKPIWLTWPMRIVALVTIIALILLRKSEFRSQGQITLTCIGLMLEYGLQAAAMCESIIGLQILHTVTLRRAMLFLRFTTFVVILLAQSVVYLSYSRDTGPLGKIQELLHTKAWSIISIVLFTTYFLAFWIYLGSDINLFIQRKGDLNQVLGGYVYLWLQDLIGRGIVCYAYFRSLTWYKHVS